MLTLISIKEQNSNKINEILQKVLRSMTFIWINYMKEDNRNEEKETTKTLSKISIWTLEFTVMMVVKEMIWKMIKWKKLILQLLDHNMLVISVLSLNKPEEKKKKSGKLRLNS